MDYATSRDVAIDRSLEHYVASNTSPSPDVECYTYRAPDVYRTSHTCLHVSRTSDIAYVEFNEEQDKENIKY